jgi:hypothetical protein
VQRDRAGENGPPRLKNAEFVRNSVDDHSFLFDGGPQIRYELPVEIILSGMFWCKANLRSLTFFAAVAVFP